MENTQIHKTKRNNPRHSSANLFFLKKSFYLDGFFMLKFLKTSTMHVQKQLSNNPEGCCLFVCCLGFFYYLRQQITSRSLIFGGVTVLNPIFIIFRIHQIISSHTADDGLVFEGVSVPWRSCCSGFRPLEGSSTQLLVAEEPGVSVTFTFVFVNTVIRK